MIQSIFQSLMDYIVALGHWRFFFEVFVIYLVIYYFIAFSEGTRGAGILKGLAMIILVVLVVGMIMVRVLKLERISWLLSIFTPTSILALIVILQPELRRGLVRISQTSFFGEFLRDEHDVIDEIIRAVFRLARNRVGALMALKAFKVDGATPADALAIGKAAGVTRLEPVMRKLLGLE